jgi:hypothetical protein
MRCIAIGSGNEWPRLRLAPLLLLVGLASASVYSQKGAASRPVESNKKVRKLSPGEIARDRDRLTVRYSERDNLLAQKGPAVKLKMTFHGESSRLEDLARTSLPLAAKDGPMFENETEQLFESPLSRTTAATLPDQIQTVPGPVFSAALGVSFDAVSSLNSGPPDATFAMSSSYFVVWANVRYAIYSKSGTLLMGPVNGNTIFAGVGNLCETTNRGDPIVQYDRLADRWILSQLAFNRVGGSGTAPSEPYIQCFAVSTTGDPRGTYFRYSVVFSPVSPSGFGDYPKLGVMPEAYYTSYNMFGGSPAGGNSGAALCASDRAKMLAGDPSAATLCGPIAFYGGGGSFLPADLDGTTLPANQKQGGLFIRQAAPEEGTPTLEIIKLKADFAAGNAKLSDGLGGPPGSTVSIPLSPTLRSCNGTGGNCVAQPGTATTLDTLGSRLMYRAAFRNRHGIESLVVVQSVDPDGDGVRSSAMRWYEIRGPFSSTPNLYQASTFDEGSANDRWMGSAAMNKDGDILLGYSIVNAATGLKPSIALAGRRTGDPLNTLETELIAVNGSGSQTTFFNGTSVVPSLRWGDYFTMQVDPADDRGFCFIGEYLPNDGAFNWRTRIVCAKYPVPVFSIAGKVYGPRGRPLTTAAVTVTGPGGLTRTTNTDASGAYRFDNIPGNDIYHLTASNRRFTFTPIEVFSDGDLTNVDLRAG